MSLKDELYSELLVKIRVEVEGINANRYGYYINNENKFKYEGEWKNLLKNGIGIEICKNNIYQGEFLNGKRNGIDEYYWKKIMYFILENGKIIV